jgi:hypothetical protein
MQKIKLTSSAVFRTEASSENPSVGYLEFILTDNKPNENNQGVPDSAFANLVESGLYMPIKVAEGGVRPDHSDAEPLGPIVELSIDDDKVPGRAVIWKSERPEAYKMLKDMQASGDNIDISWELLYSESKEDEDGVQWLQDPILRGATIVGNPAYSGRTPVLSIASKNAPIIKQLKEALEAADTLEVFKEEAQKLFENYQGGNSSLNSEENMDMQELEEKVEELSSTVEELESANEELANANSELVEANKELKEYKEQREKAEVERELLAARLQELAEAGIELSEEELEEKREVFLELSDEAFSAMITMMKEVRSAAASQTERIPDLSGDADESALDIIREGLKNLDKS